MYTYIYIYICMGIHINTVRGQLRKCSSHLSIIMFENARIIIVIIIVIIILLIIITKSNRDI